MFEQPAVHPFPDGSYFLGRDRMPMPPRPRLPVLGRQKPKKIQLVEDFSGDLGLVHLCDSCGRFSAVVVIWLPFHMRCLACDAWVDLAYVAHVRLDYPKVRRAPIIERELDPGVFWHPQYGGQVEPRQFVRDPYFAGHGEYFIQQSWRALAAEACVGDVVMSAKIVLDGALEWFAIEHEDEFDDVGDLPWSLFEEYYNECGERFMQYPCPMTYCCDHGGTGWNCLIANGAVEIVSHEEVYGPPVLLGDPSREWPFSWPQPPADRVIRLSNPNGEEGLIDAHAA